MKLPVEPHLPQHDAIPALKKRFTELFRMIATQVNGLSEGSISAQHQAQTIAPTTGKYQAGDFVRNLTPAELGTAGSKYVVIGWTCTVGGAPGTWVENRTLTGN